jgi:hypothetical protein
MLSEKWIDPRKVDWTDGFNALNGRGWGPDPSRNPFMYATLSDPIWLALRNAQNIEPRVWVVPDPIDQIIEAGATYTTAVPIEPNTWLFGLNCWIEAPGPPTNDFFIQITDEETGATVFSQPPRASNIAAATGNTPPSPSNRLIYPLSAPRAFLPPSRPIVKIVNLAASAVKCNVNLWCAVEIPLL